MKITESRLRSIIRGEIKTLMRESSAGPAGNSPIGISAEDIALLLDNTPDVNGYLTAATLGVEDGIDFMNLKTLDPLVRAVSILGKKVYSIADIENKSTDLYSYVVLNTDVKRKYRELVGDKSPLSQVFGWARAARRSARNEELGERVWVPSAEQAQEMKDAIAMLPVEEINRFCAELRAIDMGREYTTFTGTSDERKVPARSGPRRSGKADISKYRR